MTSDLEKEICSIGMEHLPSSLGNHRRAIVEIFAIQICDGHERFSDPYFTNDRGHNVGKDVLLAATAAARQLDGLPNELFEAVITRIIDRVETAEVEFKTAYSDPDGYGSATFGQIIRQLSVFRSPQRIGPE